MRQEKIMSRILKVALASAMLFAGPTLVFAANAGNNPGNTPNGTDAGVGDKGRSSEQDQKLMLDDMNTGSISSCDTQGVDQNGHCVPDDNLAR
jgi:hypothetical protein